MNSGEMFNREKKAAKLAAVLHKCGATAEDVINATPESWAMCAEAAGCHPPHSQATVDLVLAMMARLQSDEPEPKTAQQEADEAEALRIRCQRCRAEIKDGMLCEECRAEEKFEESQMSETGADRCPPRE